MQDGIISIENSETGELVNIHELLDEFIGKECSLAIAYADDIV